MLSVVSSFHSFLTLVKSRTRFLYYNAKFILLLIIVRQVAGSITVIRFDELRVTADRTTNLEYMLLSESYKF